MAAPAETFVRDSYFVPVPDEITAHDLPVAGTLPPQLTGLYLRNGPNPPPGSDPRMFVAGAGMVHGVRLEAGQARWYRNRFVKTRRDAGIRGGSASNTHVFAHAGRILSFVEVALPMELDRQLDTVGPVDFGGVDTAFTAHGKIDPARASSSPSATSSPAHTSRSTASTVQARSSNGGPSTWTPHASCTTSR